MGLVAAGGSDAVTLEPGTRPQRIADNVDDAVAFVLSFPETRQLLNGGPEDTVAKVPGMLQRCGLTFQ